MKRHIATLAVMALPVLGFAVPVAAQSPTTTVATQSTGNTKVVPLSGTVAGAESGSSRWVAINWTSLGGESRELKVTAIGSEGVHVSYPAYPVDGFSSGYWDDTLSESEIDYTALKVTIDDDAPAPQFIRVTVSWVSDAGPQTDTMDMKIGDGAGSGPTSTTQQATTTTEATTSTTQAATTQATTVTTAADPELVITGFVLVNAETGEDIRPLVDGDVIDRSEDGKRLSIRAEVEGPHESVQFIYDGSFVRNENIPPYALASNHYNNPDGYFSFKFRNGSHTLVAFPYSGDDGRGEEGTPLTMSFTYQK